MGHDDTGIVASCGGDGGGREKEKSGRKSIRGKKSNAFYRFSLTWKMWIYKFIIENGHWSIDLEPLDGACLYAFRPPLGTFLAGLLHHKRFSSLTRFKMPKWRLSVTCERMQYCFFCA